MLSSSKITVVGAGFVGTSLAFMLSKNNKVTVLDIDKNRVKNINNYVSPVKDSHIEDYIKSNELNIQATLDKKEALSSADYVIVSTPTDFDEIKNKFNTSHVDSVIKDALKYNSSSLIVIKSTIPIGHTQHLNTVNKTNRIIFSPEFLREGSALHDNLYPSRIIIGDISDQGKAFGDILIQSALKKDINLIFMSSTEAEAVKLFSNAYLAMRVSFFNELDSFAMKKNLNPKNIIDGVCFDHRIGNGYNNPSFGYGGYCLPKDTKQLAASYRNAKVSQSLIDAIISSNSIRCDSIVEEVIRFKPSRVGIYRLIMKANSNNNRFSAIQSVIKSLSKKNIEIIIFEPNIEDDFYSKFEVENNFENFVSKSDIIIANRIDKRLEVLDKSIFTRDIFGDN